MNQMADSSELSYEINGKIDKLAEEISTMEIITSKNWNDIAILKSAK